MELEWSSKPSICSWHVHKRSSALPSHEPHPVGMCQAQSLARLADHILLGDEETILCVA